MFSDFSRLTTGAIRYGKWKLINFDFNHHDPQPVGKFQLFNLQDDPNEAEDLFDAKPDIAEKMVEKFEVRN